MHPVGVTAWIFSFHRRVFCYFPLLKGLHLDALTLNQSSKCVSNMNWLYEINKFVCLVVEVADFHLTHKMLKEQCSDHDLWLQPTTWFFAGYHKCFRLDDFPRSFGLFLDVDELKALKNYVI